MSETSWTRQQHKKGEKWLKKRTKGEHVSGSWLCVRACLWEGFNTRQCGCVHLWQWATNTKQTDTAESSLCVCMEDQALFCFSSDKESRVWLAMCLQYERLSPLALRTSPDKTKRGEKEYDNNCSQYSLSWKHESNINWDWTGKKKGFSYAVSTVDKWGNAHLIRKCSDRAFACPMQQYALT